MNKSESTCELCKWRGVHDKHCYYGYEQGELVKDNDRCSHFGEKENQDKEKAFWPEYLLKPCFAEEPTVDVIPIERIEKYISEIEDDVPNVALAVKGFIGIWKSEQEKTK